MNASDLARLILDWEDRQRRADSAAEAIKAVVLAGGKTVTVGNARASYSGGRRNYDYQGAARDVPFSIVDARTEIREIVDWRAVCSDGGVEDVPFIQSEPKVTMRLLEVEAE